MIPSIDTAKYAKLLLFFVGVVLVIIGFAGVIVDMLDLHVANWGAFAVIAAGILVFLFTGTFYRLIPEYLEHNHRRRFADFYRDRPDGARQMALHDITDSAQIVLNHVEIALYQCNAGEPDEAERMLVGARENIDRMLADIPRLKK